MSISTFALQLSIVSKVYFVLGLPSVVRQRVDYRFGLDITHRFDKCLSLFFLFGVTQRILSALSFTLLSVPQVSLPQLVLHFLLIVCAFLPLLSCLPLDRKVPKPSHRLVCRPLFVFFSTSASLSATV